MDSYAVDSDAEYVPWYQRGSLGRRYLGEKTSSLSLEEDSGNHEPHTKPDGGVWSTELYSELKTGPSTNFYVGPQHKYYTIPKRLICHFSEYAKACLDGSFSEASANAVRLEDVDPDVFQWLWQWLHRGTLGVYDHYRERGGSDSKLCSKSCQMLRRVYLLGERLLFCDEFLLNINQELNEVMERAGTAGRSMLLTPDLVQEVLSNSAPLRYREWTLHLGYDILRYVCTFDFCTTVDFMDYAYCFEEDGNFAASIMVYIAKETRWAIEHWDAEVGSAVGVAETKKQFAKHRKWLAPLEPPPGNEAIWQVLRVMCTSAACTEKDLHAYSKFFEVDGVFTADLLCYMAAELRWTLEMWGGDRGEEVDIAAEKEEDWRIEQLKSDAWRMWMRSYH